MRVNGILSFLSFCDVCDVCSDCVAEHSALFLGVKVKRARCLRLMLRARST